MAFVGFEFNKINVERKDGAQGKITVSNNIDIKSVTKAELKISDNKDGAVKFGFEYTSKYGEFGGIVLGGSVMYLTSPQEANKIVEEWEKEKKVTADMMGSLVNRILAKCNIQTIILSDTIGLPPPVPLPKVKTK